MNDLNSVKSPCVNVCRLQNGICVGCGRTRDDISKWSRMTDSEKNKCVRQSHLNLKNLKIS